MAGRRHTRFNGDPNRAGAATVGLIDGRWTCAILDTLPAGTARFNEPRRRIPDGTPRMPANQLREREVDGLRTRGRDRLHLLVRRTRAEPVDRTAV